MMTLLLIYMESRTMWSYDDSEFAAVVKNIFSKAGYVVKEDSGERDYYFDYIASYNNENYGIEVKSQHRDYHELVLTLEYIIQLSAKAATSRNIKAIIVFNGIVNSETRIQIETKYSNVKVVDISNLIAATPINSELRIRLVSATTYNIDDIRPVQSEILYPWLEHEQYEDTLINELHNCKAGKKHSREFEIICQNLLQTIFSNQLTLWRNQKQSNNNLYRFDLLCRIKDKHYSTFWGIVERNFFSKYVIFEFKNYSKEITQEQIYTTEKYLYSKALRTVAIVVCANGADENSYWAAKGCFRESGKLILILEAGDLETMLNMKKKGDDPSELLLEKLDDLLMELEK